MNPIKLSRLLSGASLLAALSFTSLANADAVPPGDCAGKAPGTPCDNAGPTFDQPGVCVPKTCTKPDASFDCSTCELIDDQTDSGPSTKDAEPPSDSGSTNTGNPSDSGAGSNPSTQLHSDSSCSMYAGPIVGGASWLVIATAGLVVARQRRKRNEKR